MKDRIALSAIAPHWLQRVPVAGPILLTRPRWVIAIIVGVLAYLVLPPLPSRLKLAAAWDIGGLAFLFLFSFVMARSGPSDLRLRARRLDQGATTILILTLAGVGVSLFAIIAGLKEAKALAGKESLLPIGLAAATIIISWVLTQATFALHYAHLYYGDDPDDETRHIGGLEFPGDQHPDALDFAYFAFVIGMTFQVSDVQISERTLRRVATLHGILSFLFNTVILALAVNIASSLFG